MNTVVRQAINCVGTKFAHVGRKPGVALDCVGLVIAAYAGVKDLKPVDRYGMMPGSALVELRRVAIQVTEPQAGDIVCLFMSGLERHIGILVSDDTFVHAMPKYGVITSKLEHWKVHSFWRVT